MVGKSVLVPLFEPSHQLDVSVLAIITTHILISKRPNHIPIAITIVVVTVRLVVAIWCCVYILQVCQFFIWLCHPSLVCGIR